MACGSIAVDSILYILNKKQLSRSQLIELSKIVIKEQNSDDLEFALRTESVFVLNKENDLYIAGSVVNGLSFGVIKVSMIKKIHSRMVGRG